jgi:ubiquinone/menaquinone biosynthesis C-methylase UbiE
VKHIGLDSEVPASPFLETKNALQVSNEFTRAEAARMLKEEQLRTFDTEHICDAEWAVIQPIFDASFAGRAFSFLDVGGGNGSFADRMLAAYSGARGVVLDSADTLLRQNRPHPRKELMLARAENMQELGERKFDLIMLNWVLHHLVMESYAKTTALQRKVLANARQLLSPGGSVSVLENLYEGKVLDELPSRLIFKLTSSKLLESFVRRLGANSAGCGVCFRSRRAWREDAIRSGLVVQNFIQLTSKPIGRLKEVMLHVGFVGHGFFWLQSPEP